MHRKCTETPLFAIGDCNFSPLAAHLLCSLPISIHSWLVSGHKTNNSNNSNMPHDLPPSKKGSHIESDCTSTIIQQLHPLAHLVCACTLISVVIFCSLHQPHYVTASHSFPGDKPPERARAVQKNTETKQKWPCRTQSSAYSTGHFTPSYPFRIVTQPPSSFLCCSRPPSHHSSNLTSVCAIPR